MDDVKHKNGEKLTRLLIWFVGILMGVILTGLPIFLTLANEKAINKVQEQQINDLDEHTQEIKDAMKEFRDEVKTITENQTTIINTQLEILKRLK